MSQDKTAYWCTCATTTICHGCEIEKVVKKELGEGALLHLLNRIMPFKQPRGKENGNN